MKKTLAILAVLFIGTLIGCSADDGTKTTENTVSKRMNEEPETYTDDIDYGLIEDKYPGTDLGVLEEQLYQISMGNITPICSKSFISNELYGTWKVDTTVFDIGLGFCIQKNKTFL